MKSMKVKRYLQGLLLIICLLVTSCAQIIAVNADEQDVSLEITLEDESTPMEGVIFSMYQITDGITAPLPHLILDNTPSFKSPVKIWYAS